MVAFTGLASFGLRFDDFEIGLGGGITGEHPTVVLHFAHLPIVVRAPEPEPSAEEEP